MITVFVLAGFVLALAWLTHDADGLSFGARDIHGAQKDRDVRIGRMGTLVR